MSSGALINNIRKKEFITTPDEIIVSWANDGDKYALEYLVKKHKNFVRAKARSYFIIGGDSEDIIQEGMIGLF